MAIFTRLLHPHSTQPLKQAYLRTLTAPLDGYWKEAIIDPAPHWQMEINGQTAGYFVLGAGESIGSNWGGGLKANCLLQFYVTPRFFHRATELFAAMVIQHNVKTAVISTADPVCLAHGLDWQTAVSINSYLFEDHHPITPALPAYPRAIFRQSTTADLEQLLAFYARNNEECDSDTIDANFGTMQKYVEAMLAEGQSFILHDGDDVIGIGEWRISQAQPPYADLGMIADHKHRRRGVGTYILARFKQRCVERRLHPICSCRAGNIGSRKTIEKAGFISSHRLLEMELRH